MHSENKNIKTEQNYKKIIICYIIYKMVIFILLLLVIVIILFKFYHQTPQSGVDEVNEYGYDENGNKIEGFWYYPNCMETVFGGMRCYPYYYYPYRRYFNPLYPWTYYW